jgi:hypothetical protein
LVPGSSAPHTPEQAESWIAGTSPAITVAAEPPILPKPDGLWAKGSLNEMCARRAMTADLDAQAAVVYDKVGSAGVVQWQNISFPS